MIIPAQTLRILRPVTPFHERTSHNGMTYGLGPAGYDVRCAQDVTIHAGRCRLASTIERFEMPNDLLGVVHDKSTWARRKLFAQNTVIEPGWRGFLTLELSYDGQNSIRIRAGDPIAQIVFHRLEAPTDTPYQGKYQDQASGPQPAIGKHRRPEDEPEVD